jgi:hypothetical protein
MKNFELRIKNSPITNPPSGTQNKHLLSNRGPQNKPRLRLFVMGRSGGTSCPLPSGYPKVNPERPSTLPIGSPKVNQDFVCLILGERRYMSPNDAKHQSLRPCYRTRQRHPPRKVIKYELIVCLLWGEGERRYMSPLSGYPK